MSLFSVTPRPEGTVVTQAIYDGDRQEIVDGIEGVLAGYQRAVTPYFVSTSASVSINTYQTIASTTVTIPTGGRLLVLAQLNATMGGFLSQFKLAGNVMANPGADQQVLNVDFDNAGNYITPLMFMAYDPAPGVGAFNLDWQLRIIGVTPILMTEKRMMLAVVF